MSLLLGPSLLLAAHLSVVSLSGYHPLSALVSTLKRVVVILNTKVSSILRKKIGQEGESRLIGADPQPSYPRDIYIDFS